MKIIGLTYYFGEEELVVKCDSCLLNGNKPMFIPDHTADLRYVEVVIARISRLGKHIEPRFANRYYDGIAYGLDFVAYDRLTEAREQGKNWTEATCFDYSLAIGRVLDIDRVLSADRVLPAEQKDHADISEQIDRAISKVSEQMTIRQGDWVYVALDTDPKPVHKEEVLRKKIDGEDVLYCKIK